MISNKENAANRFNFIALVKAPPIINYSLDECIFRQGEIGEYSLLIITGKVRIEISSYQSSPSYQAIAFRGEGDLIGELSLFGQKRCASAVALEPTVCAKIPHSVLLQMLSTDSTIALALIFQLMQKIRSNEH